MKRLPSLKLVLTLALCAIASQTSSATYCNRVTSWGVSDTYCTSTDGNCDYRKFDFKRHAVGSCMSGLCMDGKGVGWVEHGVYFGKFRYGYPVGEGTLRTGSLDSTGHFIEKLILTGTFYDGCIKYDVRATVPSSGIYWQGTYNEEAGTSQGVWYLSVTNPGHSVAPIRLLDGGLSAQPTQAFADAALSRENGRLTASASKSSGTASASTRAPESSGTPALRPADPIPDENTQGPLPFSGDPAEDARTAHKYLAFPNNDRNAPLSPHMEALFRPVYIRALELFDSPDLETSKYAAAALSNLYERGWLVPKDRALYYALSSYAYTGKVKPILPH